MALVRCPECDAELDVADEDMGQLVSCGGCGATITARTPRRRSRFDDEDDDYRPRRRRRRRLRSLVEDDVEHARQLVTPPANGLILTGWISAALCLLGGIAMVMFGFVELNNVGAKAQDDGIGLMIVGVACVVLGIPYFTVMAIGGYRMKRLDGTGWGYTSMILGILTIVLLGPCVPITWAGVGVGIWAIVTMNKPEVKDVIEFNRGGQRSRDDEWDGER